MQRNFHAIPQNSAEWDEKRIGRFTASSFGDLFYSDDSETYNKCIDLVVFGKYTGEKVEHISTAYMQRGHELEPHAVTDYGRRTFNETTNGGFWTLGQWIGCSPDRMVEDDGLLEIKCPAWNTHMRYLRAKLLPDIYFWQVHGQMWVTDRAWCDFFSYYPGLPPLILRVNRDASIDKALERKLEKAIEHAEAGLNELKIYH